MPKPVPQAQSSSVLIAVSGGVDSICLLHILANFNASSESSYNPLSKFLKDHPLSKIEAAYIDHSQRLDTDLDVKNVQEMCRELGVKFNSTKLDLPKNCSEGLAREARYKALNLILKDRGLDHLVTGHHTDDIVETALINLTRGTGPKGLCSLQHQPAGIWRPFLYNLQQQRTGSRTVTKQTLLSYAKQHNLTWNEDSTNQSGQYLRNRIRKKLECSTPQLKQELLSLSISNLVLTKQIDFELQKILQAIQSSCHTYSIVKLTELPEELQAYLVHSLLTQNCSEVSARAVKDTLNFLNTKQTAKILQLKGSQIVILPKKHFKFLPGVSSQIASPLKK